MYPGTYSKTQPDKIAIVRPSTGESLTYKQLDDRSNQLAQLFHAYGLRKNDHVALLLPNSLIYFELYWACMRSGLYFTPINHHLSAIEAAYIADNCDATALIAGADLEQTVELGTLCPRARIKLSIGGAVDGFIDYEEALATQPAEKLAEEWRGSFMPYSSGTTGRPKGIRRTLAGDGPETADPALKFMGDLFGIAQDTVYLSPAPMYHAAPSGMTAMVVQMGGTVVMMDKFDGEQALELIERYRVTHSQWVPAMFIKMLKLDPEIRTRFDLSSHRCAIHAAAPCPVEAKRQMIEWWGPIIEEYYAASEGIGLSKISSSEWLAHPGSVGRSMVQPIHVCDDDGNELPTGEPGLIYGECWGQTFTYHKDQGQAAGAMHPANETWVTVGDVGYLDEEGYLYLTDRKTFMIISGGVNIYPQQIEDALAMHPKVTDVAVIGVPNKDLGEEVKAVVQVAPGYEPSDALAQEIMDFVTEKLGRQLTPRSVDFVDELPRLPTGKLAKKPLRERYWGAVAATVPLAARG